MFRADGLIPFYFSDEKGTEKYTEKDRKINNFKTNGTKIDIKLPQTASTISAAASAAPGDGVVDSGVGGGAAAPAPPTAGQAAR